MKEYKKSYTGFVIWLVLFVAAMFAAAFIKIEDINLLTLIVENIMTIGLAVLTFIIYKNEKIYWYTGLYYEDAQKLTSKQRKEYALKHFKRFAVFALIFLVYSVAAYLLKVPVAINIGVACVGIVGVALSTMNIKLEK